MKAYLQNPEPIGINKYKCTAQIGIKSIESIGTCQTTAVHQTWKECQKRGYRVRLPEGFKFDEPYPNNSKVIIDNT